MLPGISGETLLPLIKKEHNSKIIVISAKTDIDEKVNLLSMGQMIILLNHSIQKN